MPCSCSCARSRFAAFVGARAQTQYTARAQHNERLNRVVAAHSAARKRAPAHTRRRRRLCEQRRSAQTITAPSTSSSGRTRDRAPAPARPLRGDSRGARRAPTRVRPHLVAMAGLARSLAAWVREEYTSWIAARCSRFGPPRVGLRAGRTRRSDVEARVVLPALVDALGARLKPVRRARRRRHRMEPPWPGEPRADVAGPCELVFSLCPAFLRCVSPGGRRREDGVDARTVPETSNVAARRAAVPVAPPRRRRAARAWSAAEVEVGARAQRGTVRRVVDARGRARCTRRP